MVNAQEWLDKNYPKKIRKEISNLYVGGKKLEGHLDVSDFVNLEKLDCSGNKLVSLNLNGLTKLEGIDCSANELTDLDYSSLNSSNLNSLKISDNNFRSQNLTAFGRFINL